MQVHYGLDSFRPKGSIVTVGTFDGVHRGHRVVLSRLADVAHKTGNESVVFTFYPHPRLVVSSNELSLRLLSTKEEKIRQLELLGVDHIIVFPFTIGFSKLSYSEFVRTILVGRMRVSYLVVGYDHKFGRSREGNFQTLQGLAEELNFGLERLEVFPLGEDNVSSTKIRNALECGDICKANYFLGYRYTLTGRVVSGDRLGRNIGFPTANIETTDEHKLIPGHGVYAVYVKIDGEKYMGVLNIGTRPTLKYNADHRTIEVYVINFNREIYGQSITICFEKKIREEKEFEGLTELKAQLVRDKKSALELLA